MKLYVESVNRDFKKIPSCPGFKISKDGRIINKRGYLLSPYYASGYIMIKLKGSDEIRKTKLIHRLVWETYKGEIPKGMWVNHIDGSKSNNSLDNLECTTPSHNHCPARDVLKRRYCRGKEVAGGKLSEEAVSAIKELHKLGWSQHKIAAAFQVRQPSIHYILKGKTWRKVCQTH